MYVYICICMYSYIFICIYMYLSVFICIYLYLYVYMYVFICAYIYMYWDIYIYICIYVFVYIYLHVFKCICIYLYLFICIYMYTYVFICVYMYLYVLICIYLYLYIFICIYTYLYIYIYMYLFVYVCLSDAEVLWDILRVADLLRDSVWDHRAGHRGEWVSVCVCVCIMSNVVILWDGIWTRGELNNYKSHYERLKYKVTAEDLSNTLKVSVAKRQRLRSRKGLSGFEALLHRNPFITKIIIIKILIIW